MSIHVISLPIRLCLSAALFAIDILCRFSAFVSTSPASTSFANSTSQSPSFSRNTRFRSTVGGVSNNNNIRKSVQPLINGKGVSSTARKGLVFDISIPDF